MGNQNPNESANIEFIIKDFIQFLPQEKHDDYVEMLRKCNFHDKDDPLFPIMLFLLFFEESITEKIEQFEQSHSAIAVRLDQFKPQMKQSHPVFRRKNFHFIWLAVLTTLTIILLGCELVQLFLPLPERIVIREQKQENELLEIRNYWLGKLNDSEMKQHQKQTDRRWHVFLIIFAAGTAAGVIPILLMLKWRNALGKRRLLKFEPRPRQKKILRMFRDWLPRNIDNSPKG